MAYDEVRGVIVLFGGAGGLGDTWEWNGDAWTQREEQGPSGRRGHAMAYNPTTERVVLFGGISAGQGLDDTWEWDGTVWTKVAEFGVPGCLDMAMTSDGWGVVLFGGVGLSEAGEPGRNRAWAWDGRFWTEYRHFGPPGRLAHAMAFDAARRCVVLFGGAQVSGLPPAALLGDTWEHPAPGPGLVSVSVSPPETSQGGTIEVTARLSAPAAADMAVQLASSLEDQPAALGLSPVTIAVGQAAASTTTVLSTGVAPGTYAITASAGGASRTTSLVVNQAVTPYAARIVAVRPNPAGNVTQSEEVHIRNLGLTPIHLGGWRISDGQGRYWVLGPSDGLVAPLSTTVVLRRGRFMDLPNTGGLVMLIAPDGVVADTQSYEAATIGQLIQFEA